MIKLNKIKSILVIGLLALSTACGSGASAKNPVIPGVVGPTVDFVNNVLTLSMTIQSLQTSVGVRVPLGGNLPNSYIEVDPDLQSNGTLVAIGIAAADLKAFVKVTTLNPQELPGGRPLPGVPAGSLPALAIQVPQLKNVTFYIGPTVFGIFVPVGFGKSLQNYMATFSFFDQSQTKIGNLSIVGQDTTGANDGVMLLIDLSAGSKVAGLIGL